MRLADIAEFLRGELSGDPDIEITGVAKIEDAREGDLTFVANPKYLKFLKSTKASAVIISQTEEAVSVPHIRLNDPYIGFLQVLERFYPPIQPDFGGFHPTAIIEKSAQIGQNVQIGPFVYLGHNVFIGDNTSIYPGCIILDDVRIGNNCRLYPNVSIREKCILKNNIIVHNGTVIGSDGFGFAPDGEQYKKIPQMGHVLIEDDVEIGANCTIDRATLGYTHIQKGSKLDNQIQIAHNVVVGENTVIAAQTGISGSTKIGTHVTIAGQVGIVGHVKINDKAVLAAKSGISKDVPEGEIWFGYPAQPIMRQKKVEASLRHLPELAKKVSQLERNIMKIEEQQKKIGEGNVSETADD
jgi:UDP-3-O-[3-hydroxymyristoyl] glucosamine N-acyltransferase